MDMMSDPASNDPSLVLSSDIMGAALRTVVALGSLVPVGIIGWFVVPSFPWEELDAAARLACGGLVVRLVAGCWARVARMVLRMAIG